MRQTLQQAQSQLSFLILPWACTLKEMTIFSIITSRVNFLKILNLLFRFFKKIPWFTLSFQLSWILHSCMICHLSPICPKLIEMSTLLLGVGLGWITIRRCNSILTFDLIPHYHQLRLLLKALWDTSQFASELITIY